jgi:prepilin-type N-terminal cleavage/methylation domain-containing protein
MNPGAVREDEGRARPACGFTLIEVMMAMLLVSFAMLAVGAAQIQSLRSGADTDNRSQAMYLAEDQLSRFMGMSIAGLPINCTASFCNDPLNPIQVSSYSLDPNVRNPAGVGETQRYERSWRIDTPAPLTGEARRITVRVSWEVGEDSDDTTVQLVGFK